MPTLADQSIWRIMTQSAPPQEKPINMGTMLKSLETYYRYNGISPLYFRCRHWEACRKGNPKITQAKSAFVGTGYEKGVLPRLLFLSLDPGESDREPKKRTVEYLRYQEEHECKVAELRKLRHWHWYYTHDLALILLKRFRPDMNIQDSHLYFAHTNSAKCSMNHSNHKQAKSKIFKNCREYIGGEITILNPDILITQGNEARIVVERTFEVSEISEDKQICSHKWAHIGGKKTIWFRTFHPSAYGKFHQQKRDCFENWAKYVYRELQK